MLAVVFLGGGAAFGRRLVGGGEGLVVGRDVSGEDERELEMFGKTSRWWVSDRDGNGFTFA